MLDVASVAGVRPRYLDRASGEALPLEDRVAELLATPGERRPLILLTGPPGSGRSTALRWLAQRCAAGDGPLRGVPVWPQDLVSEAAEERARAIDSLASGAGILFVDATATPVDPAGWRRNSELLTLRGGPVPSVLTRCARVVATRRRGARHRQRAPGALLGPGADEDPRQLDEPRSPWELELAPWTSDDLIELLGSWPEVRARRGELFEGLSALTGATHLLGRPRAAALLVEAALALAPGEPLTLGRLYANVLDRLPERAVQLLVHMGTVPTGTKGPDRANALLERLLEGPLPVPPDELEALTGLFCLPRALVDALGRPLRLTTEHQFAGGRTEDHEVLAIGLSLARARGIPLVEALEEAGVLEWANEPAPSEPGAPPRRQPLVLPGLEHFLCAGRALEAAALGDPPARAPEAWFPFLPELMTKPLAQRLLTRLQEPEVRAHAGGLATLLHAGGVVPPLDTRAAPLDLTGAVLSCLDLSRRHLEWVVLREARLDSVSLVEAHLKGADLSEARGDASTSFARADLQLANLDRARLAGADLTGADLRGARLAGASLRGARLTGVCLEATLLMDVDLSAAHLRDANLRVAELIRVRLRGANLTCADLTEADLEEVVLTEADLEGATLTGAKLDRCALPRALAGLDAEVARFSHCDLSEADLRGARLQDARLLGCRAHGVNLEGADLRRAWLMSVDFQAGSSRAGLLLGGPALEGNMTGYYQEGVTDDAWTTPEAICQANLRGADLRGASVKVTNLFRVDLRGAKLDPDLREQARAYGAILD